MRKKLFTGLLLLAFSAPFLKAQDDITDLLKAGVNDAKVLTGAYMKSFGDMIGKSLNGGWYNTASVHKLGGFNINLGINVSMASSSGKTFDVNEYLPQMRNGWSLSNNNNHISPTIAGSMENNRPKLIYNEIGNDIEIELPDGAGLKIVPFPMIQIGVGIPFHTEIIARFLPAINLSEYGRIGAWGVGLHHSFKEYVPFLKNIPFLQTSLLVGYTHMGVKIYLDEYAEVDGEQDLDFNASGFTGRLLVGADFPVVSLYAGFGYGKTSSKFGLNGEYLVDEVNLKDPISLDFSNNSFDANIGLRLKLGVFTMFGDYTIGDYPVISGGIGFSFR